MTTIYQNMIPVEKRFVFDDNQQIMHHYISFFESDVNNVTEWKSFDRLLTGKTKGLYQLDEKTWKILNFTKWKIIERNDKTIETIEAMVM